jgi:hypothetical protein
LNQATTALEFGADVGSSVEASIVYDTITVPSGIGTTTTTDTTLGIVNDVGNIIIKGDYGAQVYNTRGTLKSWRVYGTGDTDMTAGTNFDDFLAESAYNHSLNTGDGLHSETSATLVSSAIFGVSSDRRPDQTENQIFAGVLGLNNRGADKGPVAGVIGIVNRGNNYGVVGTGYGLQSGDSSDPLLNNGGILCRGTPFCVGDPWHPASADNNGPGDTYHTLVAYPKNQHGGTYENRVGINVRLPGHALHVVGDIYASGNVTAYSDRRAKKNIEFISGSLDAISKMRGVYFDWKDPDKVYPDRKKIESTDPTKPIPPWLQRKPIGKQIGMIAQEVEPFFPELVEEDDKGELSLKYANMVGILINGINELNDKVEEQQKEINKLKNERL